MECGCSLTDLTDCKEGGVKRRTKLTLALVDDMRSRPRVPYRGLRTRSPYLPRGRVIAAGSDQFGGVGRPLGGVRLRLDSALPRT